MTPPRVLVIDNYDSFTYNLVQYLGELGCDLTVWRNDQFSLDEVAALAPDAIVVSPGPCTPTEAGQSVAVIQRFAPGIPMLGVCLGHQSMGQAYGASVVRASVPVHGKTSSITHDGAGLFAGLPPELTVTRYHSLIVEDLPPELLPVAQTPGPDGRPILMALKHRDHPMYGVQFHPESIATEAGKQMLGNFLDLAAGFRRPETATRTLGVG